MCNHLYEDLKREVGVLQKLSEEYDRLSAGSELVLADLIPVMKKINEQAEKVFLIVKENGIPPSGVAELMEHMALKTELLELKIEKMKRGT